MRLVERTRPQHADLEIPVLAGMHDALAVPALQDDLLDLLETLLRAVRVDLVAGIFMGVDQAAAAEADDQPALAEIVDQRDLLGHPQGMVERGLQHREADLDAGGHHRQRGRERRRIDIDAVSVEVMLGEKHRIAAELLGHLRFADRLVDDLLVLGRIARLGKKKHPNLHRHPRVRPRLPLACFQASVARKSLNREVALAAG